MKINKNDLLEEMVEAGRNNESVYVFNDGRIEVNSCSSEQLEFAGNVVIAELDLSTINDTFDDFDLDDADYVLDNFIEQGKINGIEF